MVRFLWDASWLYPFKGIIYFVVHPAFWPLFRSRLIPVTLLSTFVLVNLFLWTYLPQVAFLAIFHFAGAWVNGTVLVLGEAAAITALLFEAFFVDETQVDIFDAVLINEGLEDLVARGRIIIEDAPNEVKRLGNPTQSAIYAPFSFRQIVEFILLLPLNLIPFVGVPLFLVGTGYRAGPFHHWRYFKLIDLSKKQRRDYISKRKMKYMWFGISSLILQLIPVLSMLFLLTTAAGAGLWAAKMEKARRLRDSVSEPTAVAEPYVDDPV